MYDLLTNSSQEDQCVTCFNQAFTVDNKENEEYGFALIESALSELKELVSHVYNKDKMSPTQVHPNIHQSTEKSKVKKITNGTAFYPADSLSTTSNVFNSTTHTKKMFTNYESKTNSQSHKRFMKSKMKRDEEDDVATEVAFYPLCFNHEDESDTSVVIESSKMMLARTNKRIQQQSQQQQQQQQQQTRFLPSSSSSINQTNTISCFNPPVNSFQPPKQRKKSDKIKKVESNKPSLVTGPIKKFATPWDDCEDEDENASSETDKIRNQLSDGLGSITEKINFAFPLPQPDPPMKHTPAVLQIGNDSRNKVKFNNKMEVRRFSDDKCQDFTRVIEGKNRDKKLKRKWSWGSKRRASKEVAEKKPSILKRTGWIPGENITDEVIPLFSPDTQSGRVALHLGIDSDEEDEGENVGNNDVLEEANYATTVRCELWDDDEEWTPNPKLMADTPATKFKVYLRRFVNGFKIQGEKLQSLLSLHTSSGIMSGSANQSFRSPDSGEDDSGEEAKGFMTVAPTFRPMTVCV
ncbi:hypothetical protein I9W82_002137 [Candida metapsilosis]|uniref:Uncharacterized protein n=1 Tax=Candida metapsilosis TaxID=273372 RepID=A0A8H7ZJV7_9ASCO|nr:hypothetical protein I9W82_002137 [Candida metapsilosis]